MLTCVDKIKPFHCIWPFFGCIPVSEILSNLLHGMQLCSIMSYSIYNSKLRTYMPMFFCKKKPRHFVKIVRTFDLMAGHLK